jgi:hypothetical protein
VPEERPPWPIWPPGAPPIAAAPRQVVIQANDLLGVLNPISALKVEIANKSTAAVSRFNQRPTDPLTNWQKEMSAFFGTFCEQLEATGRTLLKALDARFDAISAVERELNSISLDFRRREEAAGLRVLETIEAPIPPPSIVFQAVPETPFTYDSLYSAFSPGRPIRDQTLDDFDPDGPLDDVDLVFTLEEGAAQRRFFTAPDDFFDAGGWQGPDPFATALDVEAKAGLEDAAPEKKKVKAQAKQLRRAKAVKALDRGGRKRGATVNFMTPEDGATDADTPVMLRRKSDRAAKPPLLREAAEPEPDVATFDASDGADSS